MPPAENNPGNGTDQPRPGGSSPAPRPLSRGDLFRPGDSAGARDTSQGRSEEAPDDDETSQYPADDYQPDEYRPAGYRSVEYRPVERPRPAEQPTQHLPEAQGGDEPNLFEPRRPDVGGPGAHGGAEPGGYQPGQYQPGQYQRYQPSPYQPGQYQPWQYEPAEDRTQEPSSGGEYEPGQYQPGQYQRGDYEPGQYQPGQYQPGQYQRGEDQQEQPVIRTASGAAATNLQPQTWYDDDEPKSGGKRTAFVVSLLGVALLIVTAAAAYVLFNGDDGTTTASPDAPAVTTPASTPSPTPTTEPAPTTPPPTATSRPSATASVPAGFPPIPDTPWAEKSLDFGFLTKVEQVRGTVRITFNRATFYYGDAATKQNGGVPPDNDYLIRDANPRLRTFVMDPRAPIEGSTRLGGPGATAEGVSLTMDEFLQNTSGLRGDQRSSIPVWLRHSGNGDSPVIALAEQYIP